ncbi:MAG: aldehyde dehydrogenase [Rhodobacter sp.]|nr:aldehyde dehydrogenase [Rhodobacter sp.]
MAHPSVDSSRYGPNTGLDRCTPACPDTGKGKDQEGCFRGRALSVRPHCLPRQGSTPVADAVPLRELPGCHGVRLHLFLCNCRRVLAMDRSETGAVPVIACGRAALLQPLRHPDGLSQRSSARRVLVSGPSAAGGVTVVLGANEAQLGTHRIVSNASCTTNALAPLARLLHETFCIITGSVVTIHCYTGSQPTVDAPAADFARSRAAALSMVPTTNSAQRLLDTVLPQIAGRIEGSAVRVPVASVSAVDLCVMTEQPVSVTRVNNLLSGAGGVIGATDRPLVSSDLRARPESIVMALPQTRVTPQGMLRVFGFYDNEWVFSNRMLDVARLMG